MDNYHEELREAVKTIQDGRLSEKSEDSLRSGLQALQMNYMNQGPSPAIKAAIESYENEISRRSHQEGAKTLHQLEMEQGKTHHGETKAELKDLKIAVGRLEKARCVDKWILAAGWIAAIGAVVAAWFAIFPRH